MLKSPVLRRFMKEKPQVFGLVVLLIFFITAVLGPFRKKVILLHRMLRVFMTDQVLIIGLVQIIWD